MKNILREMATYGFSLYVCAQIFKGIAIRGGIESYIIVSFLLVIGFTIVKPILSIISFPINFITLGSFSYVILAFVLFIITKIYPQVQVQPFVITSISFYHLTYKSVHINTILSYLLISATIYVIGRLVDWLFE